jgi:hypothetical protein
MAQSGFTPIITYNSGTTTNVPTAGNLANGELALNYADGKLFYKDGSGNVQVIASKSGNVNVSSFSAGTTGLTPNTATTGAVTLAGTLAVANGGTGVTTSTGTGNVVLSTSPTLVTPILGTPSSVTLTNATGLPISTGLSGLTTNGVAYATSTTALATGSALTFNGTNLSTSGAVISTSTGTSAGFTWGGSTVTSHLYDDGSGNVYIDIGAGASNTNVPLIIRTKGTGGVAFSNGVSQTMTLTSAGNLGIGTTSPGYPLDVIGTGRFNGSSPSVILNANNGTQATLQLTQVGVGNWLKYFRVSDSAFVEQFGGTDLLTLTTSGNLGLGVTPSSASLPTIQSAFGLLTGNNESTIANNAIYNSGFKYVNTGAATKYYQTGGQHSWHYASSGTAGTAVSFTQAMTLNNSGYLGIGQTSPSYPIDINSGGTAASIAFSSSIGSGTSFKLAQGIQGVSNTGFQLYDITNSAVRIAVDGSGNVGIGATSVNAKLQVSGDIKVTGTTANPLANSLCVDFASGGRLLCYGSNTSTYLPISFSRVYSDGSGYTESGRFDSSGNLLVGMTSPPSAQVSSGNLNVYGATQSNQNYVLIPFPGTSDVFTFPTDYSGIFLLTGRQNGAPNGGIFAIALAVVGTGTGTLTVTNLSTASMSFGVSGTARTVNVTNTAGGTLGVNVSYLRLNVS